MNKAEHILVLVPMEEDTAKRLEEAAPGCEFRYRTGVAPGKDGTVGGQVFHGLLNEGALTEEDALWADIVFGNIPPELIKHARRLRWIQTNSAGVEGYIRPGVLREGTLLTNATGAYGLAISEYMLGVLLELMKKLELYRDAQPEGRWVSQGGVQSVYGSTVLVLGMGDIGGEFGKRCKALGARVIGVRRTVREKPDYADEVYTAEALDELLPRADVVAVTLPGTPEARNMLSRERIGKMKPGAFLLNVGRGFLVDTEALCGALESGALSGAGLDVTEPEPLPAEHRLWRIPTAVITPHTSGFYHLRETYERIVGIFEENLKRFLAGEELKNTVDFSTGYRRL